MMYSIFEENMERLNKKLTRIANKCAKFGCDFKYEEVGEEFREFEIDRCTHETEIRRYVQVEVEGTAIVNGWQFVASIDHTDKGNLINRCSDIEVPERYYTSRPVCEHCNSSRRRKNTYIVRNTETGEFKQIGKSCLQDFTNGMSAEMAAQYISLFDNLIEGETPYEGCSITTYYDTREYLAYVVETIRAHGFASRQSGRPTADLAWDYMRADHDRAITPEALRSLQDRIEKYKIDPQKPEVIAEVEAALNWIREQPEDSNYMHNLKTAASLEYIKFKHTGILASLMPTYNKDLARQEIKKSEQDTEKDSEYVGNIKDRITINVASIKCLAEWETMYGITHLYKIIGEDGNVCIWKASRILDEDSKKITGTVKGHKEYKGIKQTELTRCKAS